MMRLLAVLVVFAGLILAGTDEPCAQNYPNKPIRIVTSAPGGGNDLTARLISQGIWAGLGQRVIVDIERQPHR